MEVPVDDLKPSKMELAMAEAVSEMSKLGLAELQRNDQRRCTFIHTGKNREDVIIHGCPSAVKACCPKLGDWVQSNWPDPVTIHESNAKLNALKNLIQFMHTSTLDMSLLVDINDFVILARASVFFRVPALLKLILRLAAVASGAVQHVARPVLGFQKPEFASVCDEVLTTRTRDCLGHLRRSAATRRATRIAATRSSSSNTVVCAQPLARPATV